MDSKHNDENMYEGVVYNRSRGQLQNPNPVERPTESKNKTVESGDTTASKCNTVTSDTFDNFDNSGTNSDEDSCNTDSTTEDSAEEAADESDIVDVDKAKEKKKKIVMPERKKEPQREN